MFSFHEFPLIMQALIALPFGLIIGSFLNVVIYRVPRGESVAFPGSHCGSCGAAIRPYDNIPLLSYLLLRGPWCDELNRVLRDVATRERADRHLEPAEGWRPHQPNAQAGEEALTHPAVHTGVVLDVLLGRVCHQC